MAAAAMVALASAAHASLVLQANGVEVLDTDTNLLWLYDWNSSGQKNWTDAKTWAASLTVGGTAAGEWRLPEIGEYDDLYTGVSGFNGLAANFSGVPIGSFWSGTENAQTPNTAWRFETAAGGALTISTSSEFYAVAVRADDVTSSVPEPQTLVLALLALSATVVARRRRPA
jgi:hypothetical protein